MLISQVRLTSLSLSFSWASLMEDYSDLQLWHGSERQLESQGQVLVLGLNPDSGSANQEWPVHGVRRILLASVVMLELICAISSPTFHE